MSVLIREEETTMSKKTEYEEKLQTQLDEFSTEIDRLKARADKTDMKLARDSAPIASEMSNSSI